MEDRIAELEAGLRAWEGKSRRRTWLLVLLPVVVAAALAYWVAARAVSVEQELAQGLGGLVGEGDARPSLGEELGQVRALAAEVRGLRPLPQQLGAEREARTRAETELAQARGQLASLNGERDGLAAALSTAKGELARAQAERTELEQRVAQLQDAAQAPNAAVAGLRRDLDAEKQRRAEADRQRSVEQQGRAAAEQTRAQLADQVAALGRERDGLAQARKELDATKAQLGDANTAAERS